MFVFCALNKHLGNIIEDSPGQTTGVGSLSLLQQIFQTQESNWGLLHCRWILHQLSYYGSPLQFHYLAPSSDKVTGNSRTTSTQVRFY